MAEILEPRYDITAPGRRDAGTPGRRDAGTPGRRDAGTPGRQRSTVTGVVTVTAAVRIHLIEDICVPS
jgi:hypothetical protein